MMAKRDSGTTKERSTSFRAAFCIAAKCLFYVLLAEHLFE
jgi:hypothetical protein